MARDAIPYANNWTQAPGFTLPLALMFRLYVMITGGTEGIVFKSTVCSGLFCRVCCLDFYYCKEDRAV